MELHTLYYLKARDSSKEKIAEAAAIMCAEHFRPFRFVKCSEFRKVVSEILKAAVPKFQLSADLWLCVPTVSSHVSKEASVIRNRIVEELFRRIDSFQRRMTTDFWNDRHTKTDFLRCN